MFVGSATILPQYVTVEGYDTLNLEYGEVKDIQGKQHKIYYCKLSNGYELFGVLYSSETRPSNAETLFDNYTGSQIQILNNNIVKTLYGNCNKQTSKTIYYNSTIKKGFMSLGPFTDIATGSVFNVNGSILYGGTKKSHTINADIENLGLINSEEFWTNVDKAIMYDSSWEKDNSTIGGGDGDYNDNYSDTIGLPDISNLNVNSISNTKFFTCYKMTPAELSKLSDELWSDNILTILSNSVLKPTDFVVSLNMIPIDVPARTVYMKAGAFYLNGATGGLISAQFVRLDCGSLEIKKKWGGAIDYQTDVSLFLPFIGEVSLNANEVIGSTISIIYTIDIMSGNCIASVRVVNDSLDAILYQYNGNVASSYAITSADYSNVFSGALQLATIGAGGSIGAGSITSIVDSTSNMLSGQSFQRTGNLSTSSGFMGIKKPYLILSRPIQSLPEDYNTFRGYVSNITLTLSECSGFTKVAEIHLENIPATSAELDELDNLLKAGVIF